MSKIDRAIEALEAMPPERRDEVADMVLELAQAILPGGPVLTPDQLAEVRRRRASGFRRGDASRIDRLLAQLK
ncbi:MAG: hypothetical protein JNJ73_01660 [Hyphomonadaceae bacterium]|nr:hypothetical protein [Hyphomonadaceae bacterium]